LDNQNDFSSLPDSNEDLMLDKSLAKETSTKKISQKKKVLSDSYIVGLKNDSSAIEKNTSSINRFKEPLLHNNAQCAQTLFDTSRKEANLEKLMKDTEKLASIYLSLLQLEETCAKSFKGIPKELLSAPLLANSQLLEPCYMLE
ncbi:8836_t:CDS:2, partial [Gigaspora margarita]